MTSPTSFHIDSRLYEKCKGLVDGKEFKNESAVIEFALHLYYYQIRIKGIKPKIISHDRSIKKTVRVNDYILEYLVQTGFFKKVELADYALDYLVEIQFKFNERCSIFEENHRTYSQKYVEREKQRN